MFEIKEEKKDIRDKAKIKVLGVGGAGCNAVNSMFENELQGVEFIVVNTDQQALEGLRVKSKIRIGGELTRGLGAGAQPSIGKQAAIDDAEAIRDVIYGADMLFITAGMGGGTGTGASPVIGEIASELGILTAAVVTKPFLFEGKIRERNSIEGIEELKKHVDATIVIENNKLLSVVQPGTPILETFRIANNVLHHAVRGISDLILIPGLINLDFADVKTIMYQSGRAVMGIGVAEGENRAVESARLAIACPLLEESSINGAKGVLINITGGTSLSLEEVHNASSLVHDAAHEDANIIFGAVIDPSYEKEVTVTVIATGFESFAERALTIEEDYVNSEKGKQPIIPNAYREEAPKKEEVISETSDIDIPTFLRKKKRKSSSRSFIF